MTQAHEQAICLRRYDFSESSLVLRLFCRESGVMGLLAKGIKKPRSPFDGGVDLLERGEAGILLSQRSVAAVLGKDSFTESGIPLGLLISWSQQDWRPKLRKSWRAVAVGCYLAEVCIRVIPEGVPEADIFDELDGALSRLDALATDHVHALTDVLVRFLRTLLIHSGYFPTLDRCCATGWPIRPGEPAWYSPTAGGLLNRDAESAFPDKIRLDDATLAVLRDVPAPVHKAQHHAGTALATLILAEQIDHVCERRTPGFDTVRRALNL